MRLVVGLGNPGKEYEISKHNIGFICLDAYAKANRLKFTKSIKWKGEVVKLPDAILLKPRTFMNNSGQAVRAVLDYYHLLPKKMGLFRSKDADLSDTLIVIHDDLDIDLGKIKVAVGSRSAGHNGVQSIINHTKTLTFKRLRLGVRTAEREKIPADKFVLQKFKSEELAAIRGLLPDIKKEL